MEAIVDVGIFFAGLGIFLASLGLGVAIWMKKE